MALAVGMRASGTVLASIYGHDQFRLFCLELKKEVKVLAHLNELG